MTEQQVATPAELELHPLHPPLSEEIGKAGELLKTKLNDKIVFSSLALIEPDKADVKAFDAGDKPAALARRLRVAGYDFVQSQSFVGTVDVTADTVENLEWLDNSQAPINFVDVVRVITAVKEDEGWQAAMRKRGVEDFELVQIDPWPAGGFIHPSIPEGHRAMRAISFVREDKFDNGYARPIQGLMAHVDITAGKVVHLEDHGVVDIPPESGRYDAEHQPQLRESPKPLSITQPEGVSFKVDGYAVEWQKWRFRVSMHPIHGLVLHRVTYDDAGKERSILYRASLSDMVVPYGDPDPMHQWKHVFDASEASIGNIPNSLKLGCDCLGEIHYFDIDLIDYKGKARQIENAICMHEEDYGILWKHYDAQTQTAEVRRSRRLVVSAIHTVGNYEYGFFWYFYLDGTLQMEVKLTGIVGVSAVAPGEERPEYAPLVSTQLASPVHQHLFNFRLDFDLDDTPMSVQEVNTRPLPLDYQDDPKIGRA
ncbi:MAG: tyramine oxidase, partial [Pseudomonadota bacterium]